MTFGNYIDERVPSTADDAPRPAASCALLPVALRSISMSRASFALLPKLRMPRLLISKVYGDSRLLRLAWAYALLTSYGLGPALHSG